MKRGCLTPRARPMEFIDLKTQYQRLKPSIDAAIQRVLDHGQLILGPEVAQLESRLAAYTGAKHCISVANGTDALQIEPPWESRRLRCVSYAAKRNSESCW